MPANRSSSNCLTARSRLFSAIESVEPRRLLATLVGSDLRIEGTAGNDRVRVETIGANVVVTQNNVAQSFAKTKVKTINANLRNGNDRIDILWNVVATTTISGEGGNDTVIGGDYKDVIYTGSGNDFVYGGRGGDFIQTSAGNDFISPGSQNDTVDAGDGVDEVSYADRSTPITGTLNATYQIGQSSNGSQTYTDLFTGTVTARTESDSLQNAETLTGGSANDTLGIRTGRLSESFPISVGKLRINGGTGNDSLSLSADFPSTSGYVDYFAMIADGGTGNDAFTTRTAGRSSVIGGAGNDTITSQEDDAKAPSIDAGEGTDLFDYWTIALRYTMPATLENLSATSGTTGGAVVTGNTQPNVIRVSVSGGTISVDAQGGNDRIEVLAADQRYVTTLSGGDGNDTILGSEFNDYISGGAGNDSISGRGGDDTIIPGTGSDTVDGGDDEDLVSYRHSSAAITASITSALEYVNPQSVTSRDEKQVTLGNVAVAGGGGAKLASVEDIEGGSGNDKFTLQTSQPDSPNAPRYPATSYGIRALGNGGNDSFSLLQTWMFNAYTYDGTFPLSADGGAGNDSFYAIGNNVVGGDGNDTITMEHDDDCPTPSIDAGAGVDFFEYWGNPGRDEYTMPAGLENIFAYADTGTQVVFGNELNNDITVYGSNVAAYGYGGNDTLRAPVGSFTTLDGGSGNDTLYGSAGDDLFLGGDGNDCIDGGLGADSIYGGAGTDRTKRDTADAIVDSIEVFF